ncbi:Clr5 domain-containing protein [Echria macrotheca]|uniref:Clr5 domain-containing protein n=1 Tax=Echria macrotheca TaxID=438768 RepID=A0AAJ0BJM6_9PEZI|nr:Clr5 domain-containing protein [Echria macrotheca]
MTKAWDEHKTVIIAEYKDSGKPLHEVRRIMEDRYKFKASTRAYRSRLDKWGVFKYSCRKRKSSNEKAPQEFEDVGGFSPPQTPRARREDGMMSPPDSLSSVSPGQTGDHAYFCTATPPSDSGSPGDSPIKAEPRPVSYQPPSQAPPGYMRHAMSLPNTGYLDQHLQYHYPYTHPPPQPQPQQPQLQYEHRSFYRQTPQGQIYQQLQGPGPMDLAMSSVSLPVPPVNQTGASPPQHPHFQGPPYQG